MQTQGQLSSHLSLQASGLKASQLSGTASVRNIWFLREHKGRN